MPESYSLELVVEETTSDDKFRCAVCGLRVSDWKIISNTFRGGVQVCGVCMPLLASALMESRELAQEVLEKYHRASGLS